MSGTNTADQIPDVFDILIDGYGFVIDRIWNTDSLRHPPSSYEYTPTFVQRTNVGAVVPLVLLNEHGAFPCPVCGVRNPSSRSEE